MTKEHFRLLDLPAELRLMVYEEIDFSSVQYVLKRRDAQLPHYIWPGPLSTTEKDSSITLLRSQTPLDILLVCREINAEAGPILKRSKKHAKPQPPRLVVDFRAAHALMFPSDTNLGVCIGSTTGARLSSGNVNEEVETFASRCIALLHRRSANTDTRGRPTMQLTIKHDDDYVHGKHAVSTMRWLNMLAPKESVKLEIVLESPLPRIRWSETQEARGVHPLALLRASIPAEKEELSSTGYGDELLIPPIPVVRVLDKEAFEKHVHFLYSY